MIEVQILNIQRAEEDVPGWMVAQLYLEYLHTQDAAPLARIFYHNEVDVVSLSKLLEHIATILSDPIESDIQYGLDLISIGKFYADTGELEYAIQVYLHGLEFDDLRGEEYQLAISELAMLHKKQEQYPDAIRLWEIAYNNGDLDACIELAKYYEHRARELDKARIWTQKALNLLDSDQYMPYERTMLSPDIKHRLNRLIRKLENIDD
jgi:tetratricopeptide (TPR) repeat protein